ncbi:hypothetical protein HAX54_005237, partial [Datura stramonium]|nr:hypothetical protein [Datura stramonium]
QLMENTNPRRPSLDAMRWCVCRCCKAKASPDRHENPTHQDFCTGTDNNGCTSIDKTLA